MLVSHAYYTGVQNRINKNRSKENEKHLAANTIKVI